MWSTKMEYDDIGEVDSLDPITKRQDYDVREDNYIEEEED